MNQSFIYFVTHVKTDHVRVGFTDDTFVRLRSHAAAGFCGHVAIVPGTYANEQSLHRLLNRYRDTDYGSSTSVYFLKNAVTNYITALLELGYATPNESEAQTWPSLPFNLWRFGARNLRRMNKEGQICLWNGAPPRDRIAFASNNAILSSRGDEWYTPADIIQRVRGVLGDIDLDPASCPRANRTVGAASFYTKPMNGLGRHLPWNGRVWLNPPYGRGPESAGAFIARLVEEFRAGNVIEAVTCLNLNSMSSEWFRPLWAAAVRHAVVYGRPDFVPPLEHGDDSSSPTKGTVLSYLGKNSDGFAREFRDMAVILAVADSDLVVSAA